jgi:hypothetical protein
MMRAPAVLARPLISSSGSSPTGWWGRITRARIARSLATPSARSSSYTFLRFLPGFPVLLSVHPSKGRVTARKRQSSNLRSKTPLPAVGSQLWSKPHHTNPKRKRGSPASHTNPRRKRGSATTHTNPKRKRGLLLTPDPDSSLLGTPLYRNSFFHRHFSPQNTSHQQLTRIPCASLRYYRQTQTGEFRITSPSDPCHGRH